MSLEHVCRRCGSTATAPWAAGLCPVCVLERGLKGYELEGSGAPDRGAAGDSSSGASSGPGIVDPMARRFFGDYQLLEEIGAGGMGVVYRALQISLGRIVALKMIRPGVLARDRDLQRFRAEAETAARLQHPNIVGIYEVGEHGGQPFFVMVHVEGQSLAQAVVASPFSPERAARCVELVAEAVHYAHQCGVLHRDLKPSNVMLDHADQPHLLDFGLARVVSEDAGLTASGTILGSPAYMSTEQATGRAAGVRSDVYSLGAILYETLTGHPPFRAATALETLALVKDEEPVAPRVFNPRLPADLETICLKCLAKSPDGRYGSARELALELGRYRRGEPIQARPIAPFERIWRWCRRQPAVAAALAIAFVSLAALAIVASVAAVRLRQEATRTNLARQDAEEKLYLSRLAEARADRLSGSGGARARGLSAVAAAAAHRPSLELRNEAAGLLALPDVGPLVMTWTNAEHLAGEFMALDAELARYAVVRPDGTVSIHRAETHELLAQLAGPPKTPGRVWFSPDGAHLGATYRSSTAVIWNLATRQVVYATTRCVADSGIAFLSGREAALIQADGRLHFVDLGTGKERDTIELEPGARWLVGSARGDEFVVGFRDRLQCWQPGQLHPVHTCRLVASSTAVAWHRDGRRLALGLLSGEMILWDRQTDHRTVIVAHSTEVERVGFSPDGNIVWSTGYDGTTHFRDAAVGHLIFSTRAGQAWNFSRDGLRLSFLNWENSFGVWDFQPARLFHCLRAPDAREEIVSLSLSADGRQILAGTSTGWRLVATGTGSELASSQEGRSIRAELHPDGNVVVGLSADRVQSWTLRWQTNGAELVAGWDSPTTLLSVPGKELRRLNLNSAGDAVAVAGYHYNAVLDWPSGRERVQFSKGQAEDYASVSPDGRWVAAADIFYRGITLWDGKTGAAVRTLVPRDRGQAGFSPDGQSLVTIGNDLVLWDTATWAVRRRLPLRQPPMPERAISFSADGRVVAVVAEMQMIKLLSTQSGAELVTLTSPVHRNLSAVALSADGGTVAALSESRGICVWDVRALRQALVAIGLDWK